MSTEICISVTDLARFCHRSGDIDHRFSPSPTGEQGVAGHQHLYARRPASYHSEFPVQYLHEEPGVRLVLRGRADGFDRQQAMVEEIKTCRVDPATIPPAVTRLHLAQGRLYAALIAAREPAPELEVRLTWFNIDTGEEHSLSQRYSDAELADFLAASLTRFSSWLRVLARLRRERDASLARLSFPHGEFRPGQRDIAELTYKCIDQGGQLLLEAPTGIGKTAAVLFPALKALATGKHDRVVFSTAKTVGRRAAEETLALFAAAGYQGTSLSLTARDRICLSPGSACHGDDCPYARNYYDRLPAALDAAMASPGLTRQDVEALAGEHQVCPYQLALDLLPWVDVVIADLHYVYSLTASLGSAMELDDRRWSVLVDEAHNLPGRARGMYSAKLTKAALMEAKSGLAGPVGKALGRLNRLLLALQKEEWQEPDFDSRDSLPRDLLTTARTVTGAVAEELVRDPRFLVRRPAILDFFFALLQFLRVAENWGEDYRLELSRGRSRQSLCLTLNCLDPARLLADSQRRAHSVTAFSATLSPLPWSRACLGLEEQAVCHQAVSPFQPDQLRVELATDIDTRFQQRAASLSALVERLCRWLARTAGNCIVYFPSYRYLLDCLEQVSGLLEDRHVWVQRQQQDQAAREELLELLARHRDLAAFCILGGVFGEGIDLPGEQLSSVVVVGVGLPQFNRETRQLQAWYQQRYGAGFEYACLYPGMQKVDQALGRVVRRAEDRGSALLIDPRYGEQQYRQLLPPWWDYHYSSGS